MDLKLLHTLTVIQYTNWDKSPVHIQVLKISIENMKDPTGTLLLANLVSRKSQFLWWTSWFLPWVTGFCCEKYPVCLLGLYPAFTLFTTREVPMFVIQTSPQLFARKKCPSLHLLRLLLRSVPKFQQFELLFLEAPQAPDWIFVTRKFKKSWQEKIRKKAIHFDGLRVSCINSRISR